MQVIFNPTGTHIHKGFLKVRLDFYPEESDLTYQLHHVSVPVIPEGGYIGSKDAEGSPLDSVAYQIWEDSLPHVFQDNPCLCHFIEIDEDTSLEELQKHLNKIFDEDTLATIDSTMILPDSAHRLSFLKSKPKLATKQVTVQDHEALKVAVNTKFDKLSISAKDKGTPNVEKPKSIDIGAGAADYNSTATAATYVDKTNPANATGTIDTWEVWFNTIAYSVKVATAYVVSGDNLTSRDYESLGTVTAGSKQTFTGLSTDVVSGDYASFECGSTPTHGNLEKENSGGSGYWYTNTICIPFTNQAFIASANAYKFAMYGTGTSPPIEVSLTDNLTGSETLSIGATMNASLNDIIKGSDVRPENISALAGLIDNLLCNDNYASGITLEQLLADILIATDDTGGIKYCIGNLSDILLGSDIRDETSSMSASLIDILKASDARILLATMLLSLADTLKASDSASYSHEALPVLTDNVKGSDSNAISGAMVAAVTDILKGSDTKVVLANMSFSLLDIFKTSDTTSLLSNISMTLTESVVGSDARSIFANMYPSLTDITKGSDAPIELTTMLAQLSDALKSNDTITVYTIIYKTLADSVKMSDSLEFLGRVLKIHLIFSQYRAIQLKTSKYRNIKTITS
jgi:hypothetical protein